MKSGSHFLSLLHSHLHAFLFTLLTHSLTPRHLFLVFHFDYSLFHNKNSSRSKHQWFILISFFFSLSLLFFSFYVGSLCLTSVLLELIHTHKHTRVDPCTISNKHEQLILQFLLSRCFFIEIGVVICVADKRYEQQQQHQQQE